MENQENKNQELAITEEQGKLEQEKEAKKTAATLKKDLVEIKIPIDPLNKTDKTGTTHFCPGR